MSITQLSRAMAVTCTSFGAVRGKVISSGFRQARWISFHECASRTNGNRQSTTECGLGCPTSATVECGRQRALRPSVVVLNVNDDFPSSVSFLQIPDCVRNVTQTVTSVDDRSHLPCLD